MTCSHSAKLIMNCISSQQSSHLYSPAFITNAQPHARQMHSYSSTLVGVITPLSIPECGDLPTLIDVRTTKKRKSVTCRRARGLCRSPLHGMSNASSSACKCQCIQSRRRRHHQRGELAPPHASGACSGRCRELMASSVVLCKNLVPRGLCVLHRFLFALQPHLRVREQSACDSGKPTESARHR